eukprot:388079-Rhodomonas_salina.4
MVFCVLQVGFLTQVSSTVSTSYARGVRCPVLRQHVLVPDHPSLPSEHPAPPMAVPGPHPASFLRTWCALPGTDLGGACYHQGPVDGQTWYRPVHVRFNVWY